MQNSLVKLSLLAVSGLALVSCGGGGGGTTPAAPVQAADQTVVVSNVGECFTLTAGTKFVWNDGRKTLVAQETFEGQLASSDVELRANDTRFGAPYYTIGGGFLHFLGVNQYDGVGVNNGKDVYSAAAQLPLTMALGDTVTMAFTSTQTRTAPPSVTVVNQNVQLTFAALETLALGGRTFTNTCKFSMPVGAQARVSWYAKGFGLIRIETLDAQGVLVPGTRATLATIVAAP